MVIENLESKLQEIEQVNKLGLGEANQELRKYTFDKSAKEEIDQEDKGNLLERLLVGEFGEFLKQNPL